MAVMRILEQNPMHAHSEVDPIVFNVAYFPVISWIWVGGEKLPCPPLL